MGAVYNKRRKEWAMRINCYKDVSIEVSRFAKSRGIYVDLIPEWLFDLFEYRVPFSDPSKAELVEFNY